MTRAVEEFFEQPLFKAKHLMTPMNEVKTIQKGEKKLQEKIDEAKCRGYSNLVVKTGSKYVGQIPARKLEENNSWTDAITELTRYTVQATDGITRLSEIFASHLAEKRNNEDPPIYFVLGKNERPLGIMTYWDLNRRSVYTYTYHILLSVEQVLKDHIAKTHNGKNNKDHDWISREEDKNLKSLFESFRSSGWESKRLTKWHFHQLCSFYSEDTCVESGVSPQFTEDVLKACKELRNKVMHPVNLIMEGRSNTGWASRLIELNKLWTEGKKAVDYLGNPKNTYLFRDGSSFADAEAEELSYHYK
ncbi:MAG: hypothetical protein JRN15_10440 [Nitrososphaerota archaeon]|nr:hypothetical protein [Nitrososphaerota archaeon]